MRAIFTVFHFGNCNTLCKLFLPSYAFLFWLPSFDPSSQSVPVSFGSCPRAPWVWPQQEGDSSTNCPPARGPEWGHWILLPFASEIASVQASEKAQQNLMLAPEKLALEYNQKSAALADVVTILVTVKVAMPCLWLGHSWGRPWLWLLMPSLPPCLPSIFQVTFSSRPVKLSLLSIFYEPPPPFYLIF